MTPRPASVPPALLRRAWGVGLAFSLVFTMAAAAARRPDDNRPPAASAPAHGPGASADDPAPRPGQRPAAGPGLTVRVTGGGQPVAQADVRFKFASGAELAGRTDEHGTVRVSPPADGMAKVRVVAVGWDSGKGEVAVKRGKPSELSIQLSRQDDPAR